MERARQLVGEMLIYCFVLVLLTGSFLAFHYTPSGELVP
jgi:quinol-cytochrome oxidoreductase complex cytochrome b subunit